MRSSIAKPSMGVAKPTMSALLDHWGVQYRHVSGWQSVLCPVTSESVPSFRVNLDEGSFKCMSCEASGNDTLALIMAREQCSFKDAVALAQAVPGATEVQSKGFNPRLDRKPRYRRKRS